MQPVLGLVPDRRARPVEHVGGDLLAGVRGQAVEDDRVGVGVREELLVQGVRREVFEALRALVLLAHARPRVGHEHLRPGRRLAGVAHDLETSRLVAGGRRAHELDAEQPARGRERDADVRPVADPRDADAVEAAEALPDRQQVGERLERVLVVRQSVDDRYRRGRGELVDLRLRARADGEAVEVAREHARGVTDRLAAGELQLGRGEVHDRAAQLRHRDRQRDARAGRVPAEEQAERQPFQRAVRLTGDPQALQLGRQVEHGFELRRGEVAHARDGAAAQVDRECGRKRAQVHAAPSRR